MKELRFSIMTHPTTLDALAEFSKVKQILDHNKIPYNSLEINDMLGSSHCFYRPKMIYTIYIIRFKNNSDFTAYQLIKE